MVEFLGFWTPVKGSLIDGYFSLVGIKAEVVPGHNVDGKEGTLLIREETSFLWTVAKVISYVTGILPLIALIAKVVFRSSHQF